MMQKIPLGFLIAWIVVLLWCEWLTFSYSISKCSRDQSDDVTRIAVVSDPQLTDWYSYHYMKSNGILATLTKFYSDIYMRKAYKRLQSRLEPHSVAFLGDLFDGGRVNSDAIYAEEIHRFNWVFSKDRESLMLNVTGNHDIGIGKYLTEQSFNRYVDHFGPVNYKVSLKDGIELVVICAPCIVHNVGRATNETWAFIDSLSSEVKTRILFTHIPLYRPQGTSCGPLRRAPLLGQGMGVSYQNLLSQLDSARILDTIKPVLVFSGDDHDQCTVPHGTVTVEHTVGTFSWLQGNIYPSFVQIYVTSPPYGMSIQPFHTKFGPVERLLPPIDTDGIMPAHKLTDMTESTRRKRSTRASTEADLEEELQRRSHDVDFAVCFLPSQMIMYIFYGILGAPTLLLLVIIPFASAMLTIVSGVPFDQHRKRKTSVIDIELGMQQTRERSASFGSNRRPVSLLPSFLRSSGGNSNGNETVRPVSPAVADSFTEKDGFMTTMQIVGTELWGKLKDGTIVLTTGILVYVFANWLAI